MIEYIAYSIAYFLGSIPTAVLVSRLFQLQNPTEQGSNNPGATNMLRIGGKKPALITLIGDFFKGTISIAIGIFFAFSQFELLILLLLCLLGHMYPIFNKFIGGKGVATFFGCMLLIDIVVGGIIALLWLGLAKIVKISSLAAIISITLSPVIAWGFGWGNSSIALFAIICLLILWRHKANIQRLINKTEK